MHITPRHLAFLGTFLFLSLTLLYLLIRFVPFFFSPEIHLLVLTSLVSQGPDENPPVEHLIVYSEKITLEGEVVSTSSLTLNGEEVYIGENGFFRKETTLTEGANTLVFEAKNRFGRKSEVVRRVVYIQNGN